MAKFKDLSGQRFSRWLVLSYEGKNKQKLSIFKCKCDCGVIKILRGTELVRGHTKSCGCSSEDSIKDLIGKQYGKLVVLKMTSQRKYRSVVWKCRCDCGNIVYVQSGALQSGNTQSCGCLNLGNLKHGMSKSVEHRTWRAMIDRCTNPNNKKYLDYGGRGITICERWLGEDGFIHFFEDMGPRPSNNHSIDRKDNDLLINGYSKDNCGWADKTIQSNNTRSVPHSNNLIEHKRWRQLLQGSLVHFVTGQAATSIYEKYLGCSVEEFLRYIESRFEPWMNWDNYGKASFKKQTWNLGHIRGCNTFDLSKEEDRLVCFNYRNLKPMDARKNAQQARAY